MSDQGTKVLSVVDAVVECREAPASHGQNWEQGKTLPVDVGKIKDYNEDREINIGRCQKWEDGNNIHTEMQICESTRQKAILEIIKHSTNPEGTINHLYEFALLIVEARRSPLISATPHS